MSGIICIFVAIKRVVIEGTWVCVYKNTNHVIRISTVNLNQDWQMIEHRLKEIIKEQEQ